MSRQMKISLSVMLLLAGACAVYFLNTARSVTEPDEPEPAFSDTELPTYDPADPPVEVRIFFPTQSDDLLLRSRDVTIFASVAAESRARQIIDHLIAGTDDALLYGRLPEGTKLAELFVSDAGTAYLDFNSAIADNHPGGILPEQATVYAIVNSLTYNVPEIRRVKILIGGVERETLAGHCMLLLPLTLDLSITDIVSRDTV